MHSLVWLTGQIYNHAWNRQLHITNPKSVFGTLLSVSKRLSSLLHCTENPKERTFAIIDRGLAGEMWTHSPWSTKQNFFWCCNPKIAGSTTYHTPQSRNTFAIWYPFDSRGLFLKNVLCLLVKKKVKKQHDKWSQSSYWFYWMESSTQLRCLNVSFLCCTAVQSLESRDSRKMEKCTVGLLGDFDRMVSMEAIVFEHTIVI